jgi:hypothetical protein
MFMTPDLREVIILGVAGNFAGHLEQAVTNIDFSAVQTDNPSAPKGIFPVYVPAQREHFLGTFPVTSDELILPFADANLKIEPELSLLCRISYDGDQVIGVTPEQFTAYNDCSVYNKEVTKISEKKNWGTASKGISSTFIGIDHFAEGGILDRYQLACYLLRDDKLHTYGVESPVKEYSYFYSRLIYWLVEKMNVQEDTGPFESIAMLLKEAYFPTYALIGVGSTRYTDYGEPTYLKPGDESIVVLYDRELYDTATIEQLLTDSHDNGVGLCILRQTVLLP